MKATLSNYRQSPRKVRLVTELIKGKKLPDALTALMFADKRAAPPIEKLLRSAIANAEKEGANPDELVVKNITVNKGVVMKRFMPRAFGRASAIRKLSSHVTVTLDKAAPRKKKAPQKKQ